MGSREKKGSTEGLEINVKKWWDAGTPAIPERATNVLQMRARRDVKCRSRWSMEPPTISTSRGSEPSWALCSGGCGMYGPKKLDHETSVELGGSVCAALGKKSKWQVQGTASSWAECSCISQCPQQWQMRNTSGGKYLGFSSNSWCLCAEDKQKKRAGSSVKTISHYCNVFKQNPKHSKRDWGRHPETRENNLGLKRFQNWMI